MRNQTRAGQAITFKVAGVELGALQNVVPADQIKWTTKGKIEARGNTTDMVVEQTNGVSNVLLSTVKLAYDRHYPLVLAPDHIWLAIAQGFAHHVNENAEALRHRFVEHEGKERIEIDVPPGKGDPFYPWIDAAKTPIMEKSVLDTFVDKLRGRVKNEMVDTIMPTFSTTTIHAHAAVAVTTMSTFKAFFNYGMRTLCGIPEVTLLGEANDWIDLAGRVQTLSRGGYNLDWWTNDLIPVLDEFVDAAEGSPNVDFWNQIIQVGGGSGGPHVTGWINVLFPYMKSFRGRARPKNRHMNWKDSSGWGGNNPGDYETANAVCPVDWNYNGIKFQMEFEAGIVGASQDSATRAICPEIGWAIADVSDI